MDHPYAKNLKEFASDPLVLLPEEELYKTHSYFGREASIEYNLITQYFLNYIVNYLQHKAVGLCCR